MTGHRHVPAPARALARELLDLFARDSALCVALNEHQATLQAAVDQLTAGLSPEAIRAVWGSAALDAGLSGRKPPVLAADQPVAALERVAHEIHVAFSRYRDVYDERRQLGFDVGMLHARLTDALVAAGFTPEEIDRASTAALAEGRYEPTAETPAS